jgi:GMP reductase
MSISNPPTLALSYDDVCLIPNFSNLDTRSNAITTQRMGVSSYNIPVIPANMKCVVDEHVAKMLYKGGYFYIMHRFGDVFDFVKKANRENWDVISISVGVKKEDFDLINKIKNSRLRVTHITVDVAHGHHELVKKMVEFIREELPCFVIGGNVCTFEGFFDLATWGCHAVKSGVGPGAACTTKLKTGFTMPMFSCITNIALRREMCCNEQVKNCMIIADGGIKHNGDIVKALVAGADWVMSGKLFAECIDSPSPEIRTESGNKKSYFGSASFHNKGHNNNVEGTLIVVDSNGMTYLEKLEEIKQDIQSGISYAGVRRVDQLYNSVRWYQVNA